MIRRLAAIASIVPLALLLGLASLAAAPVALAGDPCYHGFDLPNRSEAATVDIKAMPCAFGPTIAHVPVGATVTWYNGEEFNHLITGANQEWGSRDTELKPGQQVSYRFATAGVYPYACALHRGMSGVIVVGNPASAAAPAAPVANADSQPAADTGSANAAARSSAGPEAALAAVVAGAAIAAVAGATVIARRRRPVAIR
jgi:plastocyanin